MCLLISSSILFTDEADGGRPSGFRFPGQNVRFAPRLPRFNTATSVEEWLPSSYAVNADILCFFLIQWNINGVFLH